MQAASRIYGKCSGASSFVRRARTHGNPGPPVLPLPSLLCVLFVICLSVCRAFHYFDEDRSGAIDKEEFAKVGHHYARPGIDHLKGTLKKPHDDDPYQ